MSRLTVIVLSTMAVATVEGISSQRSLKSSFVSIGIIAGAVFYLATAMMKIASRGNGSSSQLKGPINPEPERGEDSLEIQPDSLKPKDGEQVIQQRLQPAEDLQDSLGSLPAGSSVAGQADGIEEGDDSERGEIDDRPAQIDTPDLRSPSVAEQAERREEKNAQVQGVHIAPVSGEVKNAVQVQKTYQQLTVADNEAQVISTMIRKINDSWAPQLLLEETKLIQLGEQIEHVHPLKFLETVLNNRDLKTAMRRIEGSTFPVKWKGFLYGKGDSPGFIAKCKHEDDIGNIAPYFADFCLVVKVDLTKVSPLYKAKNWEELIRFLVKSK